uniref:Uncharacterized protein n=1 Tax=Chaetoceros debilis TaxID=122233 RepID=A0A7S3Q699_9STRA
MMATLDKRWKKNQGACVVALERSKELKPTAPLDGSDDGVAEGSSDGRGLGLARLRAWCNMKGLDLDGNLFSAICSIVVPSIIIFPTLLARHWSSKLGPIAE